MNARAKTSATIVRMPYQQYTGLIALGLSSGTTITPYSFATLLSEIASSKLVKLTSFRIIFAPTVSAAPVVVQLFIVDPTTTAFIPISPARILSYSNATLVTGRYSPPNFINAGSTASAIAIKFVTDTTVTVSFEITSFATMLRDTI
jgi:hypothetical protein